jgi:phage terminase large subunit
VKQAVKEIRREVAELRAATQTTPVVRSVLELVDAEGQPVGRVYTDGTPAVGEPLFRMTEKAFRVLSSDRRIRVLTGGRAGIKSHSCARYLLALAYERPLKVLCLRELQSTLADSSFALLETLIDSDWRLREQFQVLSSEIRGINGSRFVFKGLLNYTADSIKSFENFSCAWTDESQKLSARSLRILLPTIRRPGSFYIFSLNPENAEDAVYSELVDKDRPDVAKAHFTYLENPFCSLEIRDLAGLDRKRDYSSFAHVWLGELLTVSEARIFKNWEIGVFDAAELIAEWTEEDKARGELSPDRMFTSDYQEAMKQRRKLQKSTALLFGIDWYPCAAVKCFLDPSGSVLYIDGDYFDEDPAFDELADGIIRSLPGIEHSHECRADPARPELIRHVRKKISGIEPACKWGGSILDGIAWIRGRQRVVIHERAQHVAEEFRLYSYKVDRHTEKILADQPEDDNNHCIDSLRYGLEPMIRGSRGQYARLQAKVKL